MTTIIRTETIGKRNYAVVPETIAGTCADCVMLRNDNGRPLCVSPSTRSCVMYSAILIELPFADRGE